jgi:cell division protein FtsB
MDGQQSGATVWQRLRHMLHAIEQTDETELERIERRVAALEQQQQRLQSNAAVLPADRNPEPPGQNG